MPPQLIARVLVFAALLCTAASAKPDHVKVTKAVFAQTALQPGQQVVAAVVVEVKPGLHAQSHTPSDPNYTKFEASVAKSPAVMLRKVLYPAGKDYKSFDEKPLNVYTGTITLYLLFDVAKDAKVGPTQLTGNVSYQACDDKSCFPPSNTAFTIDTEIVPAGQTAKTQNADLFTGFDPTEWTKVGTETSAAAPVEEEKGLKLFGGFVLKKNSFFLAFVAAFLAGIIFNAVPCVLPVLPLKAIGFYEISQHNRAKSIAFGAVFSLGLIASFAALGVVILVKKAVGWGEMYSNVWFNVAIVTILLVMAIGTFGAFSVNLPVGIYNITPRHDTYFGNFLFGILTAVLSTPCTFGLFFGLMAWALGQPAVIGVSLLMTVGAGMASPYFVLSAFPELARKFPRTGPWSELVKQLMSFLLLGSAVFFARRFIVPFSGADAFWWILFAVAVMAGLFLMYKAFKISPNFRARAIACVLAILLIGGTLSLTLELANQPYEWTPYSAAALESAIKSKHVVVVEFTAAWCSNCQLVETRTLHNPGVVSIVKKNKMEMIKADLTSRDAVGWPFLKEIIGKDAVPAIPFTMVYAPGSAKPRTLEGLYTADDLTKVIDQAIQSAVGPK